MRKKTIAKLKEEWHDPPGSINLDHLNPASRTVVVAVCAGHRMGFNFAWVESGEIMTERLTPEELRHIKACQRKESAPLKARELGAYNHSKYDNFKKEKLKTSDKKCMTCGKKFRSWGHGNRMCVDCR